MRLALSGASSSRSLPSTPLYADTSEVHEEEMIRLFVSAISLHITPELVNG